jgi:hypothetical protein
VRVWTDRRRTGVVLTLAACGLLLAAAIPALAGATTEPSRVKYYIVAAGAGGEAETVREIAVRLLGDEDRAADIYELNEGRPQPTGGALTPGGALQIGWVLVLPWDAVGDEVLYGELSEPSTSATAAPTGPVGPTTPTGGECSGPPSAGQAVDTWAQQQLSPQEVWPAAGRGSGVVVAVVDSGVDAGLPQLAGRVSAGVDVVTGTDSGTVDCLGTGTAMAALIVADDPQLPGIAPDATVVPIRIAVDVASATATDQATAIDVAVSAGARVVALGSYVDIALPGVRQAVDNAARHDVVVVVAGPVPDDGSLPPQLVRVGVLDSSGGLAQDYPRGTIDVLAPGQDVASLGTAGLGQVQVSGGQYAVALVAGAAALVRGAAPALAADQVVEHLTTTSTLESTPQSATGVTGAAVLNLAEAVLEAVPSPVTAPGADGSSGGGTVLVSTAILALFILSGVLLLRRRRAPRIAVSASSESTVDATDG